MWWLAKEQDYSSRQARMFKTLQTARVQRQDYLLRHTEQQQWKCWERQCWEVLTALHGAQSDLQRQKGQEDLSWMGNTLHPSVKDKKGCATLPQDTPSLEDTGQRRVQRSWTNTEVRSKVPSEEPEPVTLKGIKRGGDKGIHFLLLEESWWGIPPPMTPELPEQDQNSKRLKEKGTDLFSLMTGTRKPLLWGGTETEVPISFRRQLQLKWYEYPELPPRAQAGHIYILELFCGAVLEMLCMDLAAAKPQYLPQQQEEPPQQRQGQAADVAVLSARWHTCSNVRTGTCQLPKPTNSWASSRKTNTTTTCPNSNWGCSSSLSVVSINCSL